MIKENKISNNFKVCFYKTISHKDYHQKIFEWLIRNMSLYPC